MEFNRFKNGINNVEKYMKVGGLIFTLGMFVMIIGISFEDFAVSMAISWTGLFIMFFSVFIMIWEKSEWLDEDLFDK